MTTIDGVKYDSTGKFVITGSVLSSLPANLTIRDSVKSGVNVIQVNDRAIMNATNINQLSFGNSMSLIGTSAFHVCLNVTQINFGTGLKSIWTYAFRRADRLLSVNFPDGILNLGDACFANCAAITSFNLPSSLTSVNSGVFFASSNVETISLGMFPSNFNAIITTMIRDQPCKVKQIDFSYHGKITSGASVNGSPQGILLQFKTSLLSANIYLNVTSIDSNAFYDYTLQTLNASQAVNLQSIYSDAFRFSDLSNCLLPIGLKYIGKNSFSYCKLVSINIPSSVNQIIDLAFNSCFNLTEVIFNDNGVDKLTLITGPFEGCYRLKSLHLTWNVTGMTNGAFKGCYDLTYIRIDYPQSNIISIINDMGLQALKTLDLYDNVKLIPLMKYGIVGNSFTDPYPLEKLILRGIIGIDVGAFRYQQLRDVSIDGTNITIGNYALAGCSLLSILNMNNVTSIGSGAFDTCSSLTSVNLPNGVLSVDSYAFFYCTGMTDISFPSTMTNIGINAFDTCRSLTRILLPSSLQTIGGSAFNACSILTSLNLPSSLMSVGEAFNGCTQITVLVTNAYLSNLSAVAQSMPLTYINFNYNNLGKSDILSLNKQGTLRTVILGSSIDFIDPSMFKVHTLISSITIPTSCKSIKTSAFQGCTSLSFFEFSSGSNMQLIGVSSFQGCSKLTTFTFTQFIAEIDAYAFQNCISLTGINISSNLFLTIIDDGAFSNCSLLQVINLPASLTTIGTGAFQNCTVLTNVNISEPSVLKKIGDNAFMDCVELTNINIVNSGLTEIGNNAFRNCGKLNTINIINGVTLIGVSSFRSCVSLTSVTITSSSKLNHIHNFAFLDCIRLAGTIVIPTDLTRIGASAFQNCISLISVTISSSSKLINISNNAFQGCSRIAGTIEIPNSLTRIGEFAFDNNFSLNVIQQAVDSSNNSDLKEIASGAFNGCALLTTFVFGKFVETVENGAFGGCLGLTKIEFGNGTQTNLKTIGDNAFLDCSGLTEFIIRRTDDMSTVVEENITIGTAAFKDIKALKKITLIDNLKKIVIGKSGQTGGTFQDCSGLTSIIMSGVSAIWNNSFNGCTSLTSILLTSNIISVQDSAFTGCSNITQLEVNSYLSNLSAVVAPMNLTDLSLNNLGRVVLLDTTNNKTTLKNLAMTGITTIVPDAFNSMTALNNVTLAFTTIGIGVIGQLGQGGVFRGCNGLTRIIMSGVSAIHNNAFNSCTSLTSIRFGAAVRVVADSAFTGCANITQLEVNSYLSNLSAIVAPMNLTDLSLNNLGNLIYNVLTHKTTLKNVAITGTSMIAWDIFIGIKSLNTLSIDGINVDIGRQGYPGAFADCIGLTRIIMSGVTAIRSNTFVNCTGLTSVTLPSTVNFVDSSAFLGCVNITEFNTFSILDNFYEIVRDMALKGLDLSYNGTLPKIQMPRLEGVKLTGITAIYDSAFALCIGLTKIILSQQLSSIGNNLFYGCKKLSDITLPTTSLTNIGTQAFQECFSLKEFSIPQSVSTLGNKIFQGCSGLTKITINKTYPNLAYALYGVDNAGLEVDFNFNGNIPNGVLYNKTGLTKVTIRNIIKRIDKSAFEGCNGLTSIIFSTPNTGLSLIDNKAFANCINLQEITILSGVTQIGDYTFLNCTSLKTVIIPASVKTIGTYAFSGCSGLTGVSIVNTNSALQIIGDFAFNNCINLETISVPSNFRIVDENVFEGCVKLTKY